MALLDVEGVVAFLELLELCWLIVALLALLDLCEGIAFLDLCRVTLLGSHGDRRLRRGCLKQIEKREGVQGTIRRESRWQLRAVFQFMRGCGHVQQCRLRREEW